MAKSGHCLTAQLLISKTVSLLMSPSVFIFFFFLSRRLFSSLFVSVSAALREAQHSLTFGRAHSGEGADLDAGLGVEPGSRHVVKKLQNLPSNVDTERW